MANISFNPALMTQPQNSFQLETQGFIQGLTQDDPVSRMHLLAGIVAAAVSQPMWGGMGVSLDTPELSTDNRQGLSVGLASTTKARVPVPLASGVITSLEGVSIATAPLYWDTVALNLTLTSSGNTVALPSDVKILAVSANSRVISYNSTTGAVTWLGNQAAALLVL
jgi:hypothetical protein